MSLRSTGAAVSGGQPPGSAQAARPEMRVRHRPAFAEAAAGREGAGGAQLVVDHSAEELAVGVRERAGRLHPHRELVERHLQRLDVVVLVRARRDADQLLDVGLAGLRARGDGSAAPRAVRLGCGARRTSTPCSWNICASSTAESAPPLSVSMLSKASRMALCTLPSLAMRFAAITLRAAAARCECSAQRARSGPPRF